MVTLTSFPFGQHILVADPVSRISLELSDDTPTRVILTASMKSGLEPPISPAPYGETSVGVQMDQRVAMKLYEQLGKLIHSMGWPLPTEDESQV